MTNREAYVFGWIFGRIQRADNYSEIGGDITLACQRPLSGSAKIITAAHQKGLLKGDLDREIGEAMAELSAPPDMSGQEPVQPMELQGSWQLGYYAGKSGRPLSSAAMDIAALRRAKGMTQAKLAEAIGVDQALISRWESGKVAPNKESMAKLREVLL